MNAVSYIAKSFLKILIQMWVTSFNNCGLILRIGNFTEMRLTSKIVIEGDIQKNFLRF